MLALMDYRSNMDKRDNSYKAYVIRMIREIEIEYLIEGLKQRGFELVVKGLDLYHNKQEDV